MPTATNEPVTHDFKLYEKVLYTTSNGIEVTKQITQINGNKITIINYDAAYGGDENPIVVKPEEIRRITNSNRAKNAEAKQAAEAAAKAAKEAAILKLKENYTVDKDVKVNSGSLPQYIDAKITAVNDDVSRITVSLVPSTFTVGRNAIKIPASSGMTGGRRSRRSRRNRRTKRSARK